MNFKFVKKGILIVAVLGSLFIPSEQIAAAEVKQLLGGAQQDKIAQLDPNCLLQAEAEIQKRENIDVSIKIKGVEEIKLDEKLGEKVFVYCKSEYVLVLSTADESSDWVGKVYDTSVVEILEEGEGFSKIQSGDVIGYIKSEYLIKGKDAIVKAKELIAQKYPEKDIHTLSEEELASAFTVGLTREAEEARIAEEAAQRAAAEQAAKEAREAARRQKAVNVVNYAKRFIGNPYVYGGTSLTRGADCSGFVMSVYAHFGVSLPHSSYSMRRVGYKVSLSDIQPGDIVCFPGHVGIYAGNGKVVNAINERKGIGMSDLYARKIITVRRIY